MADLRMRPIDTAIKPPVQNDSHTDPGADGDVDEAPLALPRSPHRFRQRGGVGVVFERHADREFARQTARQIGAVPSRKKAGVFDGAARWIHRPRTRDPDTVDAGAGKSGRCAQHPAHARQRIVELQTARRAAYAQIERHVDTTGKTVAQKLYIGIGVSGAVQHLVGMQGSERILAINSDPQAPIFKVADAGIVGDYQRVVPALIAGLKRRLPKAEG